jgi:hypothetical protein
MEATTAQQQHWQLPTEQVQEPSPQGLQNSRGEFPHKKEYHQFIPNLIFTPNKTRRMFTLTHPEYLD